MKFIYIFFYLFFITSYAQKTPVYLDSTYSVEKRIEDLMNRMTLYEKACQMNQFVGLEHMKKAEKDLSPEDMKKVMPKVFIKVYFLMMLSK